MRPRTVLVVGLALLALPMAGCLSSPSSPATPERDDTHPLEAVHDIDVSEPNGTVGLGNWTVLHVEADANGSVVGTRLTVPDGAEIEHPDYDQFEAVVIEAVPLFDEADREAVETWSYMTYPELDDDELRMQGTVATELQWRTRTTPVIEEDTETGPSFRMDREYVDADEGDELPLVFGARSEEPIEAGLAVRLRAEWPDDAPEDDIDDAIEEVEDAEQVYEAPTIARADGLQVGTYFDYNFLGVFGFEIRNDHVSVQDDSPVDPRPAASVRQLQLDYAFERDVGWGYGIGLEYGDVEVSDWSVHADIHGEAASEEGVTVNAHSAGTGLATGLPLYFGVAGGEGGTVGQMAIDYVATGDLTSLLMIHIDYGATLETLVGEEGPSEVGTYGGLVGDQAASRSLEVRDDVATISGPYSQIDVLGSWDVPDEPSDGASGRLR